MTDNPGVAPNWHGIIPVVPTPFRDDLTPDLDAYQENIAGLLRAGVHGIIALATAGEGPSMTQAECVEVVAAANEAVGGRVPLLAGVGGPNEAAAAALVPQLERNGVQGLLLVTPYFYPLTRGELVSYFQRAARLTELPLMIYNSTYTGTPLDPTLVEELADTIPTFVALKEGNQGQASDVIRRTKGRLGVFSSRDLHIQELLMVGGAGAIAFSANVVPDIVVRIYDLAEQGQTVAARQIQDRLNPLVWALVGRSFPAGIKAGMTLNGFRGGRVRPPLTDYSSEERDRLAAVLADVLSKELVPAES